MTTYDNAPTVVVALIPTGNGDRTFIGIVRRDSGKIALPGGYQMRGETWQEAAVREVKEETGLDLDGTRLKVLDVKTSPAGMNLLFCYTTEVVMVPRFSSDETSEVVAVTKWTPLAFPLHEEAVQSIAFREV